MLPIVPFNFTQRGRVKEAKEAKFRGTAQNPNEVAFYTALTLPIVCVCVCMLGFERSPSQGMIVRALTRIRNATCLLLLPLCTVHLYTSPAATFLLLLSLARAFGGRGVAVVRAFPSFRFFLKTPAGLHACVCPAFPVVTSYEAVWGEERPICFLSLRSLSNFKG